MLLGHPIPDLYLHSPTLEYRQAFDLALQGSELRQEPTLAVTSSAIHAVELLKRCRAPLHFWGTDNFDPAEFIAEAQGFAWGPMRAVSSEEHEMTYSSFIWAEPEAASAKSVLRFCNELAVPGAILSIIASGSLRHFLPAWQVMPFPAKQPLSPGNVMHLLSAKGWKIDWQVGFHGPRSIIWSLIAREAEWVGRPDWADRALFAMRRTYHEPAWLWMGSPLSLIRAIFLGLKGS